MTTTPDLDPRPRKACGCPEHESQGRLALTRRSCGCPEHEAQGRLALTRRQLLGAAALGAGAAVAGPLVSTQLAFAAPDYTGDTLVVLSLRGGMDGVSVVVPHGDPDYAALRPNIALTAGQLLSGTVDTMFGLHPGLSALLPFWDAGTFGAVHACGLWGANRCATHTSDWAAVTGSQLPVACAGAVEPWRDAMDVRSSSRDAVKLRQISEIRIGYPP